MTRLLRLELARWRSRPAVAALMLAAVVFAVVSAGLSAWQSRPLSEAEVADATAQSRAAAQEPGVQGEVAACAADPAAYVGPDATAEDCAALLAPGTDSFLPREPLDLAAVVTQRGVDVALVVVGLMVVAGATFAGADWSTRSMATQLTFEPRRSRLWLGKAVAVVVGAALATALALLAFWGVLAVVAETQGLDPGRGAVTAALTQVGRATALGAVAALGSFALTMALRHTVATLTLLFVYAVGGEIALGLLPYDEAPAWSVGTGTLTWLGAAPAQSPSLLHAGLYLGGLALAAVLVSVLSFRRAEA